MGKACFSTYNNDNSFEHTGPENVHKIEWEGGVMDISLTKLTGDLDILLLGSCDPNDFIAVSNRAFPGIKSGERYISIFLNPGTYYILTDGWQGAVGEYELVVRRFDETQCEQTSNVISTLSVDHDHDHDHDFDCETPMSRLETTYLQEFEEGL